MRLVLAILIVTSLVAPVGYAADNFLAVRRHAKELLKQGRYLDALHAYVDAAELTEDPQHQATYLNSAAEIALRHLDDTAAAGKLAERIHDPVQSLRLKLIVLAAEERHQELLDIAADLDLADWPLDCQLDVYYRRGLAYAALDQPAVAARDLQHAADTLGDTSTRLNACLQLGRLYEDQLQDVDRALAAYTQATTITQGGYSSRNTCFSRRIEILLDRGQAEQALADFTTIDYNRLPSDIWRGNFYILHAEVHRQLGNNGTAATLLTRVLRLPGTTGSQKQRAQAMVETIVSEMRDSSSSQQPSSTQSP